MWSLPLPFPKNLRLPRGFPLYGPAKLKVASTTSSLIMVLLLLKSPRHSSSLTSHNREIPVDRAKRQRQNANSQEKFKREAQFRRIEYLNSNRDRLEYPQLRELEGLQSKGDPFDANLFGDDHVAFKQAHNSILARLATISASAAGTPPSEASVFYLDGFDAATTQTLLTAGFSPKNLFVANDWSATVQALSVFNINCHHGRAQDVLCEESTVKIPFCAAYLDGCGGAPEPVIEMVQALFGSMIHHSPPPCLAIGFTLTSAEPTGRELLDRIQDVSKAIFQEAKQMGYQMKHVGDDPESYGLSPNISRKHEGTSTSWIYCERDHSCKSIIPG